MAAAGGGAGGDLWESSQGGAGHEKPLHGTTVASSGPPVTDAVTAWEPVANLDQLYIPRQAITREGIISTLIPNLWPSFSAFQTGGHFMSMPDKYLTVTATWREGPVWKAFDKTKALKYLYGEN